MSGDREHLDGSQDELPKEEGPLCSGYGKNEGCEKYAKFGGRCETCYALGQPSRGEELTRTSERVTKNPFAYLRRGDKNRTEKDN